jgi:hypothetical protein
MTAFARLAEHPLRTVFAVALLIRLANVALLRGHEAFFSESDTTIYWTLGHALADRTKFVSTLLGMADRMPLYPLLLGGVQSVFGDAPRVVAFIQAAVDAGTCTLIAALGTRISPRVGLWAGVIAALSVNMVIYSTQILTDTLFLFWFVLMLHMAADFLVHPSYRTVLLAGLAGGLAVATRPAVALLLLAAMPVVAVVGYRQRVRAAPAFAMLLVFAIGAALPVAPIVLRNGLHYGHWTLTSQTGEHLIHWIVPLVTERANGTPYQATADRMQARFQQRVAERRLNADSNPFGLAAIKSDIGREELAKLPLSAAIRAWIEGMIVNLGSPALLADPRVRALPKPSFYSTPGRTLWEKARAYLLDDPGLYQALLVLGLLGTMPFVLLSAIGFVMLARMSGWAALFAFGVLAYFLLLNGPVATPKYRLPMEPVLIVLAAIPLEWLTRRRDEAPVPVPAPEAA